MISWTLLLSVPLVLIGAGTVMEWLSLWWNEERASFTDNEFLNGVEARFPAAVRVQLIDAPSLTRVRGRFRRRPAVDRLLMLGDASGASVTVDVSWLGRFTLDDSLRRVAFDLACALTEKEGCPPAQKSKKHKPCWPPQGSSQGTPGEVAQVGTEFRSALMSSYKTNKS